MSLTNASPEEAARTASVSSLALARLDADARNAALGAVHAALDAAKQEILTANAKDLTLAAKAAQDGQLSQSLVKRLDLARPGKWDDMLQGILDVRSLPDPVGRVTLRTELDDGLVLERVTCPIGTLLIIFEARPEVIANIASLAIKSGNAAILKGGKESIESFKAISSVISRALAQTAVPNDSIQLVVTREAIDPLLQLDKYINLVIPRGGNALVQYIKDHTRIPVLGHADGLCSIYLCADAEPAGAVRVILDAKLGYPAACNAVETLLVDEHALPTLLPAVASALLARGVSLRCDGPAHAALSKRLDTHEAALLQVAEDADFDTEFLDLVLAIKTIPALATTKTAVEEGVVAGVVAAKVEGEQALELAIAHINAHGSHHTDSILTRSAARAERFMAGVDSAGVYWNASTRFADGMRYGFGTEVGISTNKIHSRGPVGLDGLTIYKYKLRGSMNAAADYGAAVGAQDDDGGKRQFKHAALPIHNPRLQ